MGKSEFLTALQSKGYTADMVGSVPTVFTGNLEEKDNIISLAKECSYNYSFGIKLTQTTKAV